LGIGKWGGWKVALVLPILPILQNHWENSQLKPQLTKPLKPGILPGKPNNFPLKEYGLKEWKFP